jgi:hypothetical protein
MKCYEGFLRWVMFRMLTDSKYYLFVCIYVTILQIAVFSSRVATPSVDSESLPQLETGQSITDLFRNLRVGMKYEEVEKLLGPPGEAMIAKKVLLPELYSGFLMFNDKNKEWWREEGVIQVFFDSRNQSVSWARLIVYEKGGNFCAKFGRPSY